jgi:hypothetical protein
MYNYISQMDKVKYNFFQTYFVKCFSSVLRRPDYTVRQFGVERIFQRLAVLSCLTFDTLVGHQNKNDTIGTS